MMDPLDGFDWLLDRFHRYCHGDLIWLDARQTLHDADCLQTSYADLQREDDVATFAMALRDQPTDTLVECTDDFLWRRLRNCVDRGDLVAIAHLSMLLWLRSAAGSPVVLADKAP